MYSPDFSSVQRLRCDLHPRLPKRNRESMWKHTAYPDQKCVSTIFNESWIEMISLIPVIDKGEWIGKERLRWAHLFNIPMAEEMPPGFPRNTVQASHGA